MKNITKVIAIAIVLGCTSVYMAKFFQLFHTHNDNRTQISTTKMVDPPKMTYTVIYKDGTTSEVKANSYIWYNHKIKFMMRDTVKVKEISADIVEEVKF